MSSLPILALDTATESVSAAVLASHGLFLKTENERNKHSERLLPLADAVLKEAGVELEAVSAIAFGAGPGAFTGLRVACGVAQGLAWALDKPVVCVSNLAATASAARNRGIYGRVLVALDARMGECYVGVYDCSDRGIAEVAGATLEDPEQVYRLVQQYEVKTLVGSAFEAYADKIGRIDLPVYARVVADAASIAHVAFEMNERGETTMPALAAPLYVRNRVALTIEQRRNGEKL